jgi:hypothetical protein
VIVAEKLRFHLKTWASHDFSGKKFPSYFFFTYLCSVVQLAAVMGGGRPYI